MSDQNFPQSDREPGWLLKAILKVLKIGLIVGVFFGGGYFAYTKLLPQKKITASAVPTAVNIPPLELPSRNSPPVPLLPLPTTTVSTLVVNQPLITLAGMGWNAKRGALYSIGGARTTVGSIAERLNLNFQFTRMDMSDGLQTGFMTFAKEFSDGNRFPKNGYAFIFVMGDATAGLFAAPMNKAMRDQGIDEEVEVIGSVGRSLNEDKFMGPPEWKTNPELARGAVVIGVERDGDINIAIKWCEDNKILFNPDPTTYDPTALNVYPAPNNDYLEAAKVFVNRLQYVTSRPIAINGKLTGETKGDIIIEALATWTPGDDIAVKGLRRETYKGKDGKARVLPGVTTIASTSDYSGQMPCTILGHKRWMAENSNLVVQILDAFTQGGDQVRSHKQAFDRASEIVATVFNEKTPEYWGSLFTPTPATDVFGNVTYLGGSSVCNLADNAYIFGLAPGSKNAFRETYVSFGDAMVKFYPQYVPSYPPPEQVINTTYLERLISSKGGKVDYASAERPQFRSTGPIAEVVSSKPVSIEFASGSAQVLSSEYAKLEKIRRDLTVAQDLYIGLAAHTDTVGADIANMKLSGDRAYSVKAYLQRMDAATFPDQRFREVIAYGESRPIPGASNTFNRRVEITLGR